MKPPKSKMAELAPNATGGEKPHAEAKCARAEGVGLPECEARAAKRSQEAASAEFKMTELGPIPVDWEVKRINQCGDVVTGSTPPRGNSELWGGSFNWISAKDFKGKYIISSDEKVTEAGKRYCRALPTNSVLVTCIASIGLNAIAKRPCATNQQINAVVCRDCDYEYFYYQCCFNELRLRQMAGQTAVPIIGKSQFEGFNIVLPKEINEQRKIAEALSDIDELISALGKLIEKKRNIKTGAMQELLGMRNEECGMRNMPRRRLASFSGAWVEKRFDECFIHVPSKAYQIQATSYLGGGIYDVVDQGQSDVVGYTNDGSRLFRVPKDGVIIFGDHTRIVKFRKKDFVVGADGTQLLIGKDADTKFLSLLLGILEIPNLGYSRHFKYVKEGRYLLPPTLAEQKAIAAVLSDMDAEIAALEADRAKYERIKSGMMQELLTGKTRLGCGKWSDIVMQH